MAEHHGPIDALVERAEDYGKTTLELLKLNAVDKSADIVSFIAVRLVIFIVAALLVFILNIGVAIWIGQLVGQLYLGFFIVGGFYTVVLGIIHFYKESWIRIPVSNAIIGQLLKQKNREKEKQN